MQNEDRIDYAGPPKAWSPSPGGNQESAFLENLSTEANGGYDNIDWLRQMLDQIIRENSLLIESLDDDLNVIALRISRDSTDDKLRAAYQAEWPDPNTTPPNFIPYGYYKSLTARSTAGAAYIQKRWQEAVRDVSGTSAFDIVEIAKIVRSEAILVKGFLDQYVGEVSDSSEQRIIELFQDWAASALQRTTRYEQVAQTAETARQIPNADVESASAEEAVRYQALFKVKLNELNSNMATLMTGLRKNFADYSDVFYNKFLGPSLKFRLNVSSGLYPEGSELSVEAQLVQSSVDNNLDKLLTDQLRRNSTFTKGIDSLVDTLLERDTYRTYVSQLALVGKGLEVISNRNQMMSLSLEVVENFPLPDPLNQATPVFDAPHNFLTGRDHPDAHSQYLLKQGGVLTGDVGAEPGVRVDGVDISEHAHTGKDGTKKIKGSDIEGRTLSTDVIDTGERPAKPYNLRLIGTSVRTIPPGIALIDATVAFEGDPTLHYELQISRPESG